MTTYSPFHIVYFISVAQWKFVFADTSNFV